MDLFSILKYGVVIMEIHFDNLYMFGADSALDLANYFIGKYSNTKRLDSKQLAAGYIHIAVKYLLCGILSNYQTMKAVSDYSLNELIVMLHGKRISMSKVMRKTISTVATWNTTSKITNSLSISTIRSAYNSINTLLQDYKN